MLTHEEDAERASAAEPSPLENSGSSAVSAALGNGTSAPYAACGVRVGLEEVNSQGRACAFQSALLCPLRLEFGSTQGLRAYLGALRLG